MDIDVVVSSVADINPCDSSPCEYNGTCERRGYSDKFNCVCVPGFTGANCEIGHVSFFIFLDLWHDSKIEMSSNN